MDNNKPRADHNGLTISYKQLGTISIDELAHAVMEDIFTLRDLYNVRYVRASRLKMFATNEYGEEVCVLRPEGGRVHFMDTHHFRPACKDYEL